VVSDDDALHDHDSPSAQTEKIGVITRRRHEFQSCMGADAISRRESASGIFTRHGDEQRCRSHPLGLGLPGAARCGSGTVVA